MNSEILLIEQISKQASGTELENRSNKRDRKESKAFTDTRRVQ